MEIRRKGASDPALPSETGPQKISLKIDINALIPGQSWRGLRKLSLEIGTTDGPLSEGFAWQIHRMAADAGFYHFDAANAAWVKLYINGTYRGVFTSSEQRDEQMLRNRYLYSPYNTWLYKIDAGTFNEVSEGDSPTKTHLNFSPFVKTGWRRRRWRHRARFRCRSPAVDRHGKHADARRLRGLRGKY